MDILLDYIVAAIAILVLVFIFGYVIRVWNSRQSNLTGGAWHSESCKACDHIPAALISVSTLRHNFTKIVSHLVRRGVLSDDETNQIQEILHGAIERHQQQASQAAEVGSQGPIVAELVPGQTPPIQTVEGMARPASPAPAVPSALPQAAQPTVEHIAAATTTPFDASTAPPAGEPVAKLLTGFMQERNIRWGELISGMLVVGSGIGLVVSLWATLSGTIPYFPALILLAITAAIHGAGIYTLKKWKLGSTSHGLLVISLLLVPLCVIAGVAVQQETNVALISLAAVIGLGSTAAISVSASRLLKQQSRWPLALAVIGPCALQVAAGRMVGVESSVTLMLAIIVTAIAIFGVAVTFELRSAQQQEALAPRRSSELLLFAGTSLFSLAMPLIVIALRKQAVVETFSLAAPWLSVATIGMMAVGWFVQFRSDSPGFRMSGTALAIGGLFSSVVLIAMAYPVTFRVATVLGIHAVVLAVVARMIRHWTIAAGATIGAGLAVLLTVHGVDHQSIRILELVMSAKSFSLLTVLSACGLLLSRWVEQSDTESARGILAGAGGLSALGFVFALVTAIAQRPDAIWATPVFAVYAAGFLSIGYMRRSQELTAIGAALVLVASVNGLAFNEVVLARLTNWGWASSNPITDAVLLHGAVVAVLGAVVGRCWQAGSSEQLGKIRASFSRPLAWFAVASGAVACVGAVIVKPEGLSLLTLRLLLITIIWFVATWVTRSRVLAQLTQAASATVTAVFVAWQCQSQAWWWTRTWFWSLLHWELIGLGVWALGWSSARTLIARSKLWFASALDELQIDRVIRVALLAAVIVLPALSCLHGSLSELGMAGLFEVQLSTGVLYGGSAWLALGVVVAAFVAARGEFDRSTQFETGLLLGFAVPMLAAARFGPAPSLACATALCWFASIYGLAVSILFDRLRATADESRAGEFANARRICFVLAVVPVLLISASRAALLLEGAARLGPNGWFVENWVAALVPLIIAAVISWWYARRTELWGIACASFYLCFPLATFLTWTLTGQQNSFRNDVALGLSGLSAAAMVWLIESLFSQRAAVKDEVSAPAANEYASYHVVGLLVTVCLFFMVGGVLLSDRLGRAFFSGSDPGVFLPLEWIALCVVGALLLAKLWDRMGRLSIPSLYVWGIAASFFAIDALGPADYGVLPVFCCGVAAYFALTGLVYRSCEITPNRAALLGFGDATRTLGTTERWLPVANLFLGFPLVLISAGLMLNQGVLTSDRVIYAFTPILLAVAVGSCTSAKRLVLRVSSVLLLAAGVVLMRWSQLEMSEIKHKLLTYSLESMLALAVVAVLLIVSLWRVNRENSWARPLRLAFGIISGTTIALLLSVIGLEASVFVPNVGVDLGPIQLSLVAFTLLMLAVGLLAFALRPGDGVFSLSGTQRHLCVYGAELVVALLCLHCYLSAPQLFAGWFARYWPFAVMAIAFAGVGVAELAQRLKLPVLAEPLRRTGVFLPVVPMIGFWMHVPEFGNYASVMATASVLYLLVSLVRREAIYRVPALLAAQVALWVFLSDGGFVFWEHPQLWLIPPSIAVLCAAHLQRDQLSESQLASIRYAAMVVIYVSSTTEIFLTGIGESLWLPIVLAALSVGGVLLGIALHVRAFLYLGTSFLAVSLFTMVWHAAYALDHAWPWWAFGIGLGLLVLILFGVFEKKRNELGKLVDGVKQWDV